MTSTTSTPVLATVANMRRYAETNPIAYSPLTGEECSATPGDYFWMPDNEPLIDSEGEPMELVTSHRCIRRVNSPAMVR